MQLLKATRKQVKIKLGLQGCSGSGKTMGGLLLAYGLCGNWNKIAVVDTEHYSASLYAHLGCFYVVNMTAPFTPEKYIEAIRVCEKAGVEVIVIDSISPEWAGIGGILDIHANMAGNSFTNWSKLTPRHNTFIEAILQSPVHIIGTIRSKQDYVLTEKNGKQVPEKVGLKGITREDMDYEFTIMLNIDIKHNAIATKDRTGLFSGKPEFLITVDTGKTILNWCNQGKENTLASKEGGGINIPPPLPEAIVACNTVNELLSLYKSQTSLIQNQYSNLFTKRRQQLIVTAPNESAHISKNLNSLTNGITTS